MRAIGDPHHRGEFTASERAGGAQQRGTSTADLPGKRRDRKTTMRRRQARRSYARAFRLETERWISNDWVVQYRGHFLQLKPRAKHYGLTQLKAHVCEWEDGAEEVRCRGERMEYEDLVERPRAMPTKSDKASGKQVTDGGWKPALKHPWRKSFKQETKLRKPQEWQMGSTVREPASVSP